MSYLAVDDIDWVNIEPLDPTTDGLPDSKRITARLIDDAIYSVVDLSTCGDEWTSLSGTGLFKLVQVGLHGRGHERIVRHVDFANSAEAHHVYEGCVRDKLLGASIDVTGFEDVVPVTMVFIYPVRVIGCDGEPPDLSNLQYELSPQLQNQAMGLTCYIEDYPMPGQCVCASTRFGKCVCYHDFGNPFCDVYGSCSYGSCSGFPW